MSNLVTSIQSFFSNELVKKAISLLGEKDESIQKIFDAGVPAVLNGFLHKAKKDGGISILNMAQHAAEMNLQNNPADIFNTMSAPVPNGHTSWLSSFFGNKANELVSVIANYAGAKFSSTESILKAIIPVGLSFIGSHVKNSNFSAPGLFNWLQSQNAEVKTQVPAILKMNSFFKDEASSSSSERYHNSKPTHEGKGSGSNWLLWVLLGILFVALCWYLMRSCNNKKIAEPQAEIHLSQDSLTSNQPPARESLKVKLANGVEIDAYKGGIEDTLVKCLNDASCNPSKDVWYDFDNLNFKIGSDSLTNESMAQVKNIIEILKAYPKAKVKIGGYADHSGDSAKSWQLSQSRAEVVLNELKAQGANAEQFVAAEGYGWQFAKYPSTAPEEDRRKDRRISLQLREK